MLLKQKLKTTNGKILQSPLPIQPRYRVKKKILNNELDNALKVVNNLYIAEVNQARIEKRKISQLNVWKNFLTSHYMEFPGVGQLVQIMLATAGNTSPLERGYTYLEMVASKRRNQLKPKHLETLFLLAALKILPKEGGDYINEAKRCKKY